MDLFVYLNRSTDYGTRFHCIITNYVVVRDDRNVRVWVFYKWLDCIGMNVLECYNSGRSTCTCIYMYYMEHHSPHMVVWSPDYYW